ACLLYYSTPQPKTPDFAPCGKLDFSLISATIGPVLKNKNVSPEGRVSQYAKGLSLPDRPDKVTSALGCCVCNGRALFVGPAASCEASQGRAGASEWQKGDDRTQYGFYRAFFQDTAAEAVLHGGSAGGCQYAGLLPLPADRRHSGGQLSGRHVLCRPQPGHALCHHQLCPV